MEENMFHMFKVTCGEEKMWANASRIKTVKRAHGYGLKRKAFIDFGDNHSMVVDESVEEVMDIIADLAEDHYGDLKNSK